jgi:hypothetical protein
MQHVVDADQSLRMQAGMREGEIMRQRFWRMITINVDEAQRLATCHP